MGAAGEPAQDVFGADNGEGEGLRGAVDGGNEHQAAGLEHRGAAFQEQIQVGDVFDDFHVEDDIEALVLRGQVFSGGGAIVDGQVVFCGMSACRHDVFFGGVGAQHVETQARHGFAEEAAAAADIEQAQAREWRQALGVAFEVSDGLIANKF